MVNSTELDTAEIKDGIHTLAVHLSDIELSSFFKCSNDGDEVLFAAKNRFLNVHNYTDIQKSFLTVTGYPDLGQLEKKLLPF